MRSARLAAASLALALAVAGSAGCGGGDPTPPSAGAPPEGRYIGQTSQGLPIGFTVTGTTVRDISFGWRAICDDGQVHANTIALPGGPLSYRGFASGGELETGGVAHVEGEFDGTEASGELSRSRGSAFGTNCRATGIEWSADWSADAVPVSAPAQGVRS
jgi:hypothetical protein